MIRDYFNLSYSSLKNRGIRSWLTIIGITIGIAAVISLIGMGEGLKMTIASQFNFLSTDILTIQASGLNYGPPGSGAVNPLKEGYLAGLERINGVDVAIGRLIETARIEYGNKANMGYLASMPDNPKRRVIEMTIQLEAQNGRLLKDGDANAIVVGSNYASDNNAFGKAVEVGSRLTIKDKEFEVIGVLKKKGSFTVDLAIQMNEKELENLYPSNNTYDMMVAKISKNADIAEVKLRIDEYLRKERKVKKGEEDFTVQSPQQAVAALDSILFAIRIFVYVIAGISIVVGGIGIANTMYTSVAERTKQIGIMKSIGARNSDIFNLFLIESGLLGVAGGGLGVAIGLGLANGLVFIGKTALGIDAITVDSSPVLIMSTLAFSFIIGSVFGLLPAIQASKLKPVDALRHVK
ncbi:MAG: ABC transporter permease [archaeon]